MSQDSCKRNTNIKREKEEEEEEKILFFRIVLPYYRILTLSQSTCCAVLFLFISFVVFDAFSCSLLLLPSITKLVEMPHRMRKIVSRCRPPFIGMRRNRHKHGTPHHCMFLNSLT